MPPAARLTDPHVCPLATPAPPGPAIPHVGGPVLAGDPAVLIAGLAAARVGDPCFCVPPAPPDTIVGGSLSVLIKGSPAARLGDLTAHGGHITAGCLSVEIGG